MKILLYILAALIGGRLYFFFLEDRNLYFPSKRMEQTPESIGLAYDDLSLTTADGVKIKAWFIPADGAVSTVIFSHGNAGNMSHRLYTIEHFHTMGLNVIIYDYRGYGNSEGKPSEKKLYQDSEAVYSYLINERKIDPKKIILFGRSLGGAVAIDLASKNTVGALISDSTFSSTVDMGKRIYPFLPVHWFIKQKYDSIRKVSRITAPKLFIHSRDDEIVPFELGEKLYAAAAEPKERYIMTGGHNEAVVSAGEEYFERIRSFLKKHDLLSEDT